MTISVGDKFVLNTDATGYPIGSPSYSILKKGTEVEVRKIGASSVWVRGKRTTDRWPHTDNEVTIPVYLSYYENDLDVFAQTLFDVAPDPNAPKPRALGTPPEGENIIGIDHPGIQWLWDDLGVYATKQNFCAEYDKLATTIGIPGRAKNFKVNRTVNGFSVTKTFKARSKKEAESMFDQELATVDLTAAVTA